MLSEADLMHKVYFGYFGYFAPYKLWDAVVMSFKRRKINLISSKLEAEKYLETEIN